MESAILDIIKKYCEIEENGVNLIFNSSLKKLKNYFLPEFKSIGYKKTVERKNLLVFEKKADVAASDIDILIFKSSCIFSFIHDSDNNVNV